MVVECKLLKIKIGILRKRKTENLQLQAEFLNAGLNGGKAYGYYFLSAVNMTEKIENQGKRPLQN